MRKSFIRPFSFALLLVPFASCSAAPPKKEALKIPQPPTHTLTEVKQSKWLVKKKKGAGIEISGMTLDDDGNLLIVADSAKEPLYVLSPKKGETKPKKLPWGQYKGFKEYLDGVGKRYANLDGPKRWDSEGISRCGQMTYVVNERVREVVEIDEVKKTIRLLPVLVDSELHKIYSEGKPNAGLESVAVDCPRKVLYVAIERDPKRIIEIDLAKTDASGNHPVRAHYDFAGSTDLPPEQANPRNPGKTFLSSPDVSDLYFEGDHLYLLERNAYAIAKMNRESREIVARWSFKGLLVDGIPVTRLFDTGEPYGLAEALILTKDSIWIGFDANESALTAEASKAIATKNPRPALILELERPKGM